MQARLKNILFDGTTNPHAQFTLDKESTKIFDGVVMRRETVERPNEHGNFVLPGYRGPRSIPLSGLIFSRNLYDQQHSMALLASLLEDGDHAELSIMADIETLSTQVERVGEPSLEILNPGSVARYRFLFRAPDPRWRGEVHEFPGASVQVHHYGTFPAVPEITVHGPITGPYTVTGPGGKRVTISQPLSAGQSHVLDFVRGGVWRAGQRVPNVITRWEPFEIRPGLRQTVSISAGSMTVRVANTY